MAHPKAELYREERAKGKSYAQIAKEQGVSYQAVWSACRDIQDARFRAWTKERCIYPNLRNWLNENRCTLVGFVLRMGLVHSGTNMGRFAEYFRGVCYPGKKTIDIMLEVTGLTYGQLWEVEK